MGKKIAALALCAALALSMCACSADGEPAQTVDPYAGMVQVDSGYGTTMWVKEYENVPVCGWDRSLFREGSTFIRYTGSDYAVFQGIDVSEHQQEIDWQRAALAGVDFAMIRAGYRGYSEGKLYEDAYFRRNIEGAQAQGINAGIYFFSQATTVEEAVEEADYLIGLLDGYTPDMPVFFDWESIDGDEARTDNVTGETLTQCAVAFCERLKEAGLEPGVYAYRYLAYFYYDLELIEPYKLWIGAVGTEPDFYYEHDIWQFTDSGTVDGIEGPVDLNLMLVPIGGAQSAAATQAAGSDS